MGPVFYLVQCDGGLPPISAVLVGNRPHEFALPAPGGRGGRWLPRAAGTRRSRRRRKAGGGVFPAILKTVVPTKPARRSSCLSAASDREVGFLHILELQTKEGQVPDARRRRAKARRASSRCSIAQSARLPSACRRRQETEASRAAEEQSD